MSIAPLMPKATAVWLVDNTALSFDQVADFCKMHPLEVRAIADGDAAQGIKGSEEALHKLLGVLARAWRKRARPNTSVNARPSGVPPSPAPGCAYHPSAGLGATPPAPRYLER